MSGLTFIFLHDKLPGAERVKEIDLGVVCSSVIYVVSN